MAHAVLIITITTMVLISIHPFGFRKALLIVLALVGFSAVCFADPVLVARRYSPARTGIVAACPVRIPTSKSTERFEPISAWNAVGWDKAGASGPNAIFFGLAALPGEREADARKDGIGRLIYPTAMTAR